MLEELLAGLPDGGKRPSDVGGHLPERAHRSPVRESSSSDDGVELGGPQPGGVQRREVPDVGAITVMPVAMRWPFQDS